MSTPAYAEPETLPAGVGEGWQEVVIVANPAAGADWTMVVPGHEIWRVIGARAVYTASAAAATRTVEWQLRDGNNGVFWSVWPPGSIVANDVGTFVLTLGMGFEVSRSFVFHTHLPVGVFLPPGFIFQPVTSNRQAADQWSNIRVTIDKYQTHGRRLTRQRRRR